MTPLSNKTIVYFFCQLGARNSIVNWVRQHASMNFKELYNSIPSSLWLQWLLWKVNLSNIYVQHNQYTPDDLRSMYHWTEVQTKLLQTIKDNFNYDLELFK